MSCSLRTSYASFKTFSFMCRMTAQEITLAVLTSLRDLSLVLGMALLALLISQHNTLVLESTHPSISLRPPSIQQHMLTPPGQTSQLHNLLTLSAPVMPTFIQPAGCQDHPTSRHIQDPPAKPSTIAIRPREIAGPMQLPRGYLGPRCLSMLKLPGSLRVCFHAASAWKRWSHLTCSSLWQEMAALLLCMSRLAAISTVHRSAALQQLHETYI